MPNGEIDPNAARMPGFLGICMILCGVSCCVPGGMWFSKVVAVTHSDFNAKDYHEGIGLWGGLPLIFAGALGIAVWRNRTRGLATLATVVSAAVCIACVAQAWISGNITTKLNDAIAIICSDAHQCDPAVRGALNSLFDIFLSICIFSVLGAISTLAGAICLGHASSRASQGQVLSLVTMPQTSVISVVQTSQGPAPPPYGYPVINPNHPGYAADPLGYPVGQHVSEDIAGIQNPGYNLGDANNMK